MNPQIKAAGLRALIAAVIAVGPLIIAELQGRAWDPEYSAYIFFAVRIAEGVIDGLRNKYGDIKRADVGYDAISAMNDPAPPVAPRFHAGN